MFDDLPQKPSGSGKEALQKQRKKPMPVPRKSSFQDAPALVGGGAQTDEGEASEAEASSRGFATPGVSGAVSQFSKSLNDLDECSDVDELRAFRHSPVCLCKSAEDVCTNRPPVPTKPRPYDGKVLKKSTSNGPAQSENATPPAIRNRACSEGDPIAPPPSQYDDDYVPMEPTHSVTSSRHSNGYYLQLLPTDGETTLESPDGMYMEMCVEVSKGLWDTPRQLADGPCSSVTTSEGMMSLGTWELQRTEGRSKRSLSSPTLPVQPLSGEHQGDASQCPRGGIHPPIVPKRPIVDKCSGSTSSDECGYTIIPPIKKWFSSSQGVDPPRETTPTKREVALIKPPDPPPKSKSLLREQGVLLMEDKVKKRPVVDKGRQSASAAEPVVKEMTKKEKCTPKVEPYSGSRGPKSPSPVKAAGTKASMSVLTEVRKPNVVVSTHAPVTNQSSSESDFEVANAWGQKKPLPLRPPPPKASRTKVYDQNVYSGSPVDNGREPNPGGKEPSPKRRTNNLGTKIDRTSLLVIMENREAIYKKLGLGSCELSSGGAEEEGSSTVDILGKILKQIDSLLNSKLYSETEFIKAIETHLNIRLSSPPAEGHGKEGEGPVRGKVSRVVLTDQDVERVKQLVRASCFNDDDSDQESQWGQGSGVNGKERAEECGGGRERSSQERSDSDCEYVSSISQPSSPTTTTRKPHSLSLSTLDINQVKPGGGADRRPSKLADDVINNIFPWGSGFGTFTEKGGVLTRSGSGVQVEIPQGAISRDKRQQVWFEMKDAFALEDPAEETCPLVRQGGGPLALCIIRGSSDEVEKHFRSKVDTIVQLSPTVEVGPSDAMLFKALQVTIPHCLALKSLGWSIHVEGRECPSGEWLRLPKSHSSLLACKSKAGVFWNSYYQLHLNHVTVYSSQLGAFRLVGSPLMKGLRSGKKMMASVYAQSNQGMEESSSCVQVSVFIINDLQDHSEALDIVLPARGYGNAKQKLSFYCTGDGRDLEVMLECDSSHVRRVPSTQCVPFGQFWRQKKIGQSQVTFYLDTMGKGAGPFTVTMKVHQVGAEDRDISQCTFLLE